MAWGQLGFFTPLHMLMRQLQIPPLDLLQVSVMAYFGLGLAGMFVWLRRHVSDLAAVLGSVVYVFSGFAIGHLNHVNFYTSTMLLPWLFVGIEAFMRAPGLRRAMMVSGIAAAIVVSGQPQVVLYTGLAAVGPTIVFFWKRVTHVHEKRRYITSVVCFGGLSLVVAFGLGSYALLPLQELLPLTDRSDSLSVEELYEFSYPPAHAITLVLPYFFGDSNFYWGAKGFYELAAFSGIIPLLLAGVALYPQRHTRAWRLVGISLVAVGVLFALGKYSPLYRWVVTHNILTALAVPGRYVFFFDFGIALLCAIGLDDIGRLLTASKRQRRATLSLSLVFVAALLAPFIWTAWANDDWLRQLKGIIKQGEAAALFLFGGVMLFLGVYYFLSRTSRYQSLGRVALVVVAIITLLMFGWNYNPVTSRSLAKQESPFAHILRDYAREQGLPARLYSTEAIAPAGDASSSRATDHISPLFSVYQPLRLSGATTACLEVPILSNLQYRGTTAVRLLTGLNGAVEREIDIAPHTLMGRDSLELCFPELRDNPQANYVLAFTSTETSPIRLVQSTYDGADKAYFVRVPEPSEAQLLASQKQLRIHYQPLHRETIDQEALLLTRHINVTAHASSARWIGALSLNTFREFIDTFFANDPDPAHAQEESQFIRKNRTLLNMAGVTHVLHSVPSGAADDLPANGFTLVEKFDVGANEARLYVNPQALPKVFLTEEARFRPAADETRHALRAPNYNPYQLIFYDGPVPPEQSDIVAHDVGEQGTATLTHYSSQRVDIAVETPQAALLVLTDSTTPQWQTFIDDELAPHFRANTIFKAAVVPSGKHTVSFRYH
ncbi:MAG: hypothetical protein WD972_02615, partial [Candidatus Andersenbacteria bacterium]